MQNIENVFLLLLVILIMVLAGCILMVVFRTSEGYLGSSEKSHKNTHQNTEYINGDVEAIENWAQAPPYDPETAVLGATEKGSVEAGAYDRETATAEIYDELMPYVREVGTSKHVEEYLVKNLDLKAPKPDARAAKTKYPKLYQAIDDIVFFYETLRLPDFLRLTGLRYEHFLPENKRGVFLQNYKKHIDRDMEKTLRKQFDKNMGRIRYITEKQLDNLIRHLVPGHRYYKLRVGYAKKTASAIKRAGIKALEPDKLALLPVVDLYVDWINSTSDRAEVVRVLSKIDTNRLRDFEIALLNKLLKRVEFTDYEQMLRKQLKWERKALEREKIVQEKAKIEQERKETQLEKERLAARKAKLESDEKEFHSKKAEPKPPKDDPKPPKDDPKPPKDDPKPPKDDPKPPKEKEDIVESARPKSRMLSSGPFYPGQTVYNRYTGEEGKIVGLRNDKDAQERRRKGEPAYYHTSWDTYVGEDNITTDPDDLHPWVLESKKAKEEPEPEAEMKEEEENEEEKKKDDKPEEIKEEKEDEQTVGPFPLQGDPETQEIADLE